jgi:cytochrome P450
MKESLSPEHSVQSLGLCPLHQIEEATDEAWEEYDGLRVAGDPVWDEHEQAWLLASYDGMRKMMPGEYDDWKSAMIPSPELPTPLGMEFDEWMDFQGNGGRLNLAMLDGPLHNDYHRWWMATFSPKVLSHWKETLVLPLAYAEIDRFIETGQAELCSEFVDPVTPKIMAAALGFPFDDDFVVEVLEHDYWSVQGLVAARRFQKPEDVDKELIERAVAASVALRELCAPHVEARRSGEGDDFISLVWRDADNLFKEDDPTAEVVGWAISAFRGGIGNTFATAGSGLYLLARQPELQERLRLDKDGDRTRFVEEVLRLYGPTEVRPRVARRDVVVGDVTIKKGEMVIGLPGAASRDPSHYTCPAAVSFDRPSPRDHFAFSMGQRACPGQGLARVQLEAIVEATIERLGDLRIDESRPEPKWTVHRSTLRRWAPVHVRFAPGPVRAGEVTLSAGHRRTKRESDGVRQ